MGDKKEKEKGGTWNRLMAMKMLGGKASTGTARAAQNDTDNKRRSAQLSSTVSTSKSENSRKGLSDLFKSGVFFFFFFQKSPFATISCQ